MLHFTRPKIGNLNTKFGYYMTNHGGLKPGLMGRLFSEKNRVRGREGGRL